MKISKIVIKDIEIILSDEEVNEEQFYKEHEHKCQCSKGEDSFLNSLGNMVEVFSETITDYLKDELSGKKKVKEEVKKNVSDLEEKASEIQEKPIINEVENKEEDEPIIEKIEPKEVKEEKVEEVEKVEKVEKPESKENTEAKKIEEQRKKLLKNLNPSSDLNDFINKILNNMPDK